METKGSVQEKESFFKRKDIEISVKRYLQDALSAMALGLFASLLIGVIFNTIGEQTANLFGENMVSSFFVEVGGIAQQYMGAAIGVAVAWSLKAPPLVLFTSVVTGMMGATMLGFGIEVSGGPAGAFLAVAVGAEFGKMVSKETKVDILVTPAVTLITGAIVAKLAGAIIGPISTCIFKMTNIAVGAGMGTSGLVGQIGTFTDMGFSLDTLWKVLLLQIFLPAILTLIIDRTLRKMGKIKDGDYKLEL